MWRVFTALCTYAHTAGRRDWTARCACWSPSSTTVFAVRKQPKCSPFCKPTWWWRSITLPSLQMQDAPKRCRVPNGVFMCTNEKDANEGMDTGLDLGRVNMWRKRWLLGSVCSACSACIQVPPGRARGQQARCVQHKPCRYLRWHDIATAAAGCLPNKPVKDRFQALSTEWLVNG